MGRLTSILPVALTAIALGAVAVWPSYVRHAEAASRVNAYPTMAPVTRDYADRGRIIAFWERAVGEHHPGDMLSPRNLGEAYLQRYREHGDIDDVLRAKHMAQESLRAQPRGNTGALAGIASADLTLHRFKDALAITKSMERLQPGRKDLLVREASLDLEIGDYAGAKRLIEKLGPSGPYDIGHDTLVARYDELTGRLGEARTVLERPSAYENSQFDAPAQARAWFFFRAGELAFEAGDNDGAIADEKRALGVFPNFADAYRAEARVECALERWRDCLASATASANIVPYPETLGYQADAQRALGDDAAARATDDTIRAIEKIGNAQHVSDRLLAIYYSEHRIHTADAYRIAKRELAVRDDILTEDTLAWAAAMDGRWDEARSADAKAMRFDTEIPLMQYHAGVIAEHFGERERAKRSFEKALALNARFHQVYADDARARLAKL
ncbi:MAG: hypothetical protein NVS2B3_00070 [Vulcanimicrobiaceae bacterium]